MSAAASFDPSEEAAHELDRQDPLRGYRRRFHIPEGAAYFCGNSLGLQPLGAAEQVAAELEAWSRLAVDGHFKDEMPWYTYHERFAEPAARLVGARPDEVVLMNSLTVNLHLMMVTFYRPTASRHKILIEPSAFPSDIYAVKSQIAHHGFDPEQALIEMTPTAGGSTVELSDTEGLLHARGDEIALVMLGGVNYFTGQLFDMQRITEVAHEKGCTVGFDLAHAAGNVPLRLHDWEVDFAVWCSYKYLNGGPGAVAGCFVHRRHASRTDLPRFAGWWGNDPEQRFRMHLEPVFRARPSADGWQLSNPPILALAPLRASLEIFDAAGMAALRAKSERLTAYLEGFIDLHADDSLEILTPRDPASRGSQLSLRVHRRAGELFDTLRSEGIVADSRKPDVVRLAPVPLYNSFHDVWRAGRVLAGHFGPR